LPKWAHDLARTRFERVFFHEFVFLSDPGTLSRFTDPMRHTWFAIRKYSRLMR